MKKIYILVLLLAISFSTFAQQAGTIDTEYGVNGFAVTNIAFEGYSRTKDVAVQSDGKAVIVGQVRTPTSNFDIAITRNNTDGTLDNTFGNNGIILLENADITDYGTSVEIQQDGKIVVCGYEYKNKVEEVVYRFNTDGTPDNSWGTNGKVKTSYPGLNMLPLDMKIQEDGKIVTGGYVADKFSLVRYNTDGTLDNTFGTNGITYLSSEPFISQVEAISIQSDGKIVATGLNFIENYAFTVVRFNTDGSLDNTFGQNGQVKYNIGYGNDFSVAVNVLPDGKILIGGHSWVANIPVLKYDLALLRLNPDGQIDTSFGNNGAVTTQVVDGENYVFDMLVDFEGYITLIGYVIENQEYDIVVSRYNSDGTTDTGFGTNGILRVDYNGNTDFGNAIAFNSTNSKYIVTGHVTFENGSSDFLTFQVNSGLEINSNCEKIENNLKIYPNPIKDFIKIESATFIKDSKIEIINMQGVVVLESKIESNMEINTSNLPKGAYVLRYISNNKIETYSIIKL